MINLAEHIRSKSLLQLRDYFLAGHKPVSDDLLQALANDPRQGARKLAQLLHRRRSEKLKESRRLRDLFKLEHELWKQGIRLIAGVDEAGMAPLAGPIVAAAVILPRRYKLPGLKDSKKIADECKRAQLAHQIKRDAISWAVGWADVGEIDKINVYHAGLLAMKRAVESLDVQPEYLLVDARIIPHCPYPQKGIIRGDSLSASIAAASIIAKTTRDQHMIAWDRVYPGYGFASHKGYPTASHLKALQSLGPLPIHRKSFAPVRALLGSAPEQKILFQSKMAGE